MSKKIKKINYSEIEEMEYKNREMSNILSIMEQPFYFFNHPMTRMIQRRLEKLK